MDAEDVAQIADSLRRSLSADTGRASSVLDEFGWYELLVEEPQVAVATAFTLAGELLTSGSTLDAVVLAAAGVPVPGRDTRMVLPPPGTQHPTSQRGGDGAVLIHGIVQQGTGAVVVPCYDTDGVLAFAVCHAPLPSVADPIDETAGWIRIGASVPLRCPTAEFWPLDSQRWPVMVAAGRRALSHELLGLGARMLALTVEHVRTREQFKRPLGSFQAVKHQLADVHLWHEVAALSAAAAWEDCGVHSAALAKSAAMRLTRTARRTCQQLLGGMGFTWEHDFHRYLRRALTLEPLLGSTAELHAELGAVVRTGELSDSLFAL